MTEIVTVEYNESITNVDTCENVYTVVLDNSQVEVCIGDVILKETIEYITEEEEMYDIEIDTSVPNVTYVGQAAPGTASSVASWRIKRITETSGGSSVDWAGGTADFVHIWNNHLSLTYGP